MSIQPLSDDAVLPLAERLANTPRVRNARPSGVSRADCVQDLCLYLLRERGRYDHDPVPYLSWLCRKAVGCLQDQYQRERRQPVGLYGARPGGLVEGGSGARVVTSMVDEDWAERLDEMIDLRDCIARLPDSQRRVAEAVFLEHRRQKDVAADLGVKEAAVSRMLKRAKDTLRSMLCGDRLSPP